MQRIDLNLGARRCPILIGPGLLGMQAVLAEYAGDRQLMVVSNETVAPLWLPRLRAGLGGRPFAQFLLPDGEQHKTLASAGRIIDALVDAGMNRDCVVMALGGGVVGDIVGFAAATYQRGVAYLQLPTTLLAQVDSSIGGKTGVNHPGGKNLIGAFHQPAAVIADTDTLATLPDRELRAGLAEVIKSALIADGSFFTWLEQRIEALLERRPEALAEAIRRACGIKAGIVASDEREQGPRAILNLGHSFGHAIETGLGHGTWLHGEAVSAGIVLAAELSARSGRLAAADVLRVRNLLARAGLPVEPPQLGRGRMLSLLGMDKKVAGGRLRLVLLDSIGSASCTADFPQATLGKLLEDKAGVGDT